LKVELSESISRSTMCSSETVIEFPLGHWDAVIQILKYSKSGLVMKTGDELR